jgi:hypothetical protein
MESKQVKEKPVGVTRVGEKLVSWQDKDLLQPSSTSARAPHGEWELDARA